MARSAGSPLPRPGRPGCQNALLCQSRIHVSTYCGRQLWIPLTLWNLWNLWDLLGLGGAAGRAVARYKADVRPRRSTNHSDKYHCTALSVPSVEAMGCISGALIVECAVCVRNSPAKVFWSPGALKCCGLASPESSETRRLTMMESLRDCRQCQHSRVL